MTLTFDASALFTPASERELFDLSTSVATGVGLPVSTWQVGDPTLTGLTCLASRLAAVEKSVAGYFASGFLSSASGDWLTLLAWEHFRVLRVSDSYATGIATISNSTTTKFSWEPNGLTLKNRSTGRTYKNSATVTLLPGSSVVLSYVAEESGSGSTALANSLDLQLSIKGVAVESSAAAIGVDEQSDASLRLDCVAKLSGLSPNGAWYASEAVAKNPKLTGVVSCRKSQAVAGPVGTGTVLTYVSDVASLLTGPDLISVAQAVAKLATPIGMTPVVHHATPRIANASGRIVIRNGADRDAVKIRATQEIQRIFLDIPIGGGSGPGFTQGNLGNMLINERIFRSLEDWNEGLVREISLSTDMAGGVINPGELIMLGSSPSISVTY